jgi:hypothetical protein
MSACVSKTTADLTAASTKESVTQFVTQHTDAQDLRQRTATIALTILHGECKAYVCAMKDIPDQIVECIKRSAARSAGIAFREYARHASQTQ